MAEGMVRVEPLPDVPVRANGVTITAASAFARYSLRMREPAGVPARVMATAAFGAGHALCLGPDEWLLLLPEGDAPMIEGSHALTDISHRQAALIVEGTHAEALLQEGIALDLALPAFPVGKATRTLHESVEIVLWRTAEQRFHVEVWRSFSPHLWNSLALAAGDTG